jgi:predicted Rossmann fold nucleotide-binding protein DprA/Smf involved in DNA uptake
MDLRNSDVRVGIVGSRRRTDRERIETYIAQLAPDTVVVTGGARGPDQWAGEAARARGLAVAVHKPDLGGASTRWQMADRYYARNQRIVDDSDLIVAFVAPDRTGGTEDTIRRAKRAGKPVEVR